MWSVREARYVNTARVVLDSRGNLYDNWGEALLDPAEYVLERYIGVLDRGSQSIFENDIVRLNYRRNSYLDFWSNGIPNQAGDLFRVEWYATNSGYIIHSLRDADISYAAVATYLQASTVVGNFHTWRRQNG